MSDDSEAWKGEDDDAFGQPLFSGFLFGKPMTAEQRAQYRKACAEQLAAANLRYLTMPGYRPMQACVKCGHAKAKTLYIEGGTSDDWRPGPGRNQAGTHEHLLRTCKRCHYTWYEKTLSDEDA